MLAHRAADSTPCWRPNWVHNRSAPIINTHSISS